MHDNSLRFDKIVLPMIPRFAADLHSSH